MFDPHQFGERVHMLRRRQGLTLRALGEKAGINYVTVSRIERGQMPHVSADIMVRLAEALKVSLDYLAECKEVTLSKEEFIHWEVLCAAVTGSKRTIEWFLEGKRREGTQYLEKNHHIKPVKGKPPFHLTDRGRSYLKELRSKMQRLAWPEVSGQL